LKPLAMRLPVTTTSSTFAAGVSAAGAWAAAGEASIAAATKQVVPSRIVFWREIVFIVPSYLIIPNRHSDTILTVMQFGSARLFALLLPTANGLLR
jgi:hypothetical protein